MDLIHQHGKVQMLEQLIIDVVVSNQGLKLTELIPKTFTALKMTGDFTFDEVSSISIPQFITVMIENEKLVEIEYILPNMTYRIKSFILPPNTEVHLNV